MLTEPGLTLVLVPMPDHVSECIWETEILTLRINHPKHDRCHFLVRLCRKVVGEVRQSRRMILQGRIVICDLRSDESGDSDVEGVLVDNGCT